MEYRTETREHAVDRVYSQPEEEVVLVVTPNDLHDNPAEVHLADYYAVPHSVKQLKTLFLMGCFSLY
jgi:hypothetical protein